MGQNILKKSIIVGIVFLLLSTVCLPVSANEGKQNLIVDKTQSLSNEDNISKNIKIQCFGIYAIDIPLAILRLPVFYVRIQIDNYNNVSISVDQHLKLTTRSGRVLDEFDDNIPFPLIHYSSVQTQYWIRAMWKYWHYLFGFFDLTLDFSLRDYDYQTTLLFHGLVFGCGAVIFNPYGEKITS